MRINDTKFFAFDQYFPVDKSTPSYKKKNAKKGESGELY